jgi:hypothetical protein
MTKKLLGKEVKKVLPPCGQKRCDKKLFLCPLWRTERAKFRNPTKTGSLKITTAVFSEKLESLQHSLWHIPESQTHNCSLEKLRKIKVKYTSPEGSRDSSAAVAIRLLTGWTRNWVSTTGRNKRYFLPPQSQDRLWGSSGLLYNG